MQFILAQLLEELLATALLTVAVFLTLLFALQRDRTSATLVGIFAVVGQVLGGPARFVRVLLDELAQRSKASASGNREPAHLLTRRFLFATRLVIVVVALAVVSAGLVRGWNAMVPAQSVVDAYNAAVGEKFMLDSLIPIRRSSLDRLDAVWKRDSARWVQAYADTLRARIDRDDKARADIREQASARRPAARQQFGNIFREVDSDRQGWSDSDLAAAYQRRVGELFASLRGLDEPTLRNLGFESRDSSVFQDYFRAWSDQRSATRLLARWHRTDVRAELQAEHGPLFRETAASLTRQAGLEGELPQLRAARQWRPLNFVKESFNALLTAFIFVWTFGLVIEILSLVFDIAAGAAAYFRRARTQSDAVARDAPEAR